MKRGEQTPSRVQKRKTDSIESPENERELHRKSAENRDPIENPKRKKGPIEGVERERRLHQEFGKRKEISSKTSRKKQTPSKATT
jgi:hypothetical protein